MWFLLSSIAAVFYASVWILGRASRGIPSSIATSVQHCMGLPLLIYMSWRVDFPWDNPLWYVFLFIVFFLSTPMVWALAYAMQRTEIGVIKPLSGLSSVYSLFLAALLFGEKFTPLAILGVLICTGGLFLLYHGRWKAWRTPYPWIVICCVFMFGLNAVVSREIMKTFPHPVAISALLFTASSFLPTIQSFRSHKHMVWSGKNIFLLAIFSFVTLVQEVASTMALSLAPAAYMFSVKRTSILIAAIAGYYLFNERDVPLPRLVCATLLVILGNVVLAFR